MVTLAVGKLIAALIAAKKPDAPPPITNICAVVLILI
jgi:hypothetical protein